MGKIKAILFAVFLATASILFAVTNTYANEVCVAAGVSDPILCGNHNSNEERELINRTSNVLSVVYTFIGIAAVIVIIIGSIILMTSSGSPEKVQTAKRAILYAILGLVVTLSAFAATTLSINALEGNTQTSAADDEKIRQRNTEHAKVKAISAINETTILIDQSIKLKPVVIPDYAENKSLSYKTSDASTATVDENGKVTPKKVGDVTITIISADGPTKDVKVHVVKPISVEKININPTALTLSIGKTATIRAEALPRNAVDRTITWTSSNPQSVTVTQTGEVKAVGSGKATIIVASKDKSVTATALVTVQGGADGSLETEPAPVGKKAPKNLDFRAATRKIIDQHRKDFDWCNYESKIKELGGYTAYVKSLGGIFADNVNKKFKVKTAAELQYAAEYVWGLWTIWGPDYDNGSTYHKWGLGAADGFHNCHGDRHAGSGYSQEEINDLLSKKRKVRTNCNASQTTFNKTTDLFQIDSTKFNTQARMSPVGRITKTNQLQVGDWVHFFRQPGYTKWGHVAMVGEVYDDYVIIYEGGGRFVESTYFKHKLKRTGDGRLSDSYSFYKSWFGVRPFKIDQSVYLKGMNP